MAETANEDANVEEYKALTSILHSFFNFHQWEYEQLIKPKRIKLASLNEEEKSLLSWYPRHISDLEMAIGINEQFCQNMVLLMAPFWGVPADPSKWAPTQYSNYDKVRSTLLQLMREWSDQGIQERDVAYRKLFGELCERFPDINTRKDVKVLVPGCGLGRIIFELVKLGFWCQGNEFSYHMLVTSNYILNHCAISNSNTIFPFIHRASHVQRRLNQLAPVTIPDISTVAIQEVAEKHPEIPFGELMSMTAGSFVDLYGPEDISYSDIYTGDPMASQFRSSNKNSFDVVITCFFIDTASNIIEYLKTIRHCLKQDGLWINFGPLLWHHENDSSTHIIKKKFSKDAPVSECLSVPQGLELSRDDLIYLVKKMGFVYEKYESNIKSTYCTDPRALGYFMYDCEYWVCRNKL